MPKGTGVSIVLRSGLPIHLVTYPFDFFANSVLATPSTLYGGWTAADWVVCVVAAGAFWIGASGDRCVDMVFLEVP